MKNSYLLNPIYILTTQKSVGTKLTLLSLELNN